MLHCLRLPLSANPSRRPSSPPWQGTSNEGTPRSSSQASPTVNLSHEYTFAIQTSSYGEIWSKFHPNNSSSQEIETEQLNGPGEEELLANVLQPKKESVREALQFAKPCTLTHLVCAYFDQSEKCFRLCLLLHHGVQRARSLYAPLANLISVLPLDSESESLNQAQCDQAFQMFRQFDSHDNPFPHPDSHNFNEIRDCFTDLDQQLKSELSKCQSRIRLVRRTTIGCAVCLIGTTIGVALSAAAIATHALVALVAGPALTACLPSKINKKQLAYMAQLEAAARGVYYLQNDLNTIDRLVALLHAEIEGDKLLIRLGMDRGSERHPIEEVAKQLQMSQSNFLDQLSDLEEHLCLCFAATNRARSSLLREIVVHQVHST